MQLLEFAAIPFSYLLRFLYELCNSYLISVTLMAIISKLLYLPFDLLNMKNMSKIAAMAPTIEKIKEKHSDSQTNPKHKEKLNEEVSNLYDIVGYKGGSGCLLYVVQIFFFIAVFYAVTRPLTSIFGIDANEVSAITEYFAQIGIYMPERFTQLSILYELTKLSPEQLAIAAPAIANIKLPSMTFLSMTLSSTPSIWPITISTIIPPLACLGTIKSMIKSIKKPVSPNADKKEIYKKYTSIIPVVMTMIIAFRVPLIVGFYWIVKNIFAPIYSLLIKKIGRTQKLVTRYTEIINKEGDLQNANK